MKNTRAQDAAVIAIVIAVSSTIPGLKALADTHVDELERLLWPAGAPAVVSWTLLRDLQIEALRESTASLVERDIDLAARRGSPWPGGSSIRRETAVRVGIADTILARVETVRVTSLLDTMVFGKAPPPLSLSLRELFTVTATLMLTLSRRLGERDASIDPVEGGRVLVRMMGEFLSALDALLVRVQDEQGTAIVDKLLEALPPLREALQREEGET